MEYENIIFDLNLLRSRHPDVCWESYLSPISRGQKNLPVHMTKDIPFYSGIASCLDQIDQVRETFPEGYELLIKGKLMELFFFFSGAMKRHLPLLHPAPKKELERTRQILKYVEQHYNRPLSIEEVSDACGMSQSHFMRFF